jgi:hypothetical protein
VDVGVDQAQCVAAVLALAARRPFRGTQERLGQPECEALLSDPRTTVEEEARRQRPTDDRAEKALAERVVAVEGNDRHGGKDGPVPARCHLTPQST